MRQAFRKINLWLYAHLFKPILFRFSADSVHAFITAAGGFSQKIPGLMWLISFGVRHKSKSLETELAGLKFVNPIGLSAGFDKEVALPKLMRAVGFGLSEVGSITALPYDGNPKPWYLRLPNTKSLVVNSGLRSSGVQKIAKATDARFAGPLDNFHINASIAKTNLACKQTIEQSVNDYITTFKRLEKSNWHSMYTINISCPNTMGGEPFNKPENLEKLLKAVDDLKLNKPVFLKLPIDLGWAKTKALIDVTKKSSLAGLTIGNLSKDRTQIDKRDQLDLRQKGHLSGKPCWNNSNLLIQKTRKTYGDRFFIIGVGGVFSAEDAYTKIKLGANLVEMITGMVFRGPAAIGDINYGLEKLLKADGYDSIQQAVGVDA